MASTASCVVIGAGIAGASTAFFLASKGMRDVVLVDRDAVASGATGYSAAYAFLHHANPWKVALSARGLEMYRNWADLVGGDCSWRQVGYLWVVSPEESEKLRTHVDAIARTQPGYRMNVLGPEDMEVNWPYYNVEDVGAASYEPDAGHADGSDAANSLARRFRDMGGRLLQGTAVASIEIGGERVRGVRTSAGEEISTPAVVLAAGAWSARLAETAGVRLDLQPSLICAGIAERPAEVQPLTTVLDRAAGTWFRPDAARMTLVSIPASRRMKSMMDPETYPRDVDYASRVQGARRLAHRIPALADAYWRRSYAVPDAYTPDHMPLVGPVSGIEGIYINSGFSGYGFMQGPPAGLCVAEMIVDGRVRTVDVAALRPSRFEDGHPIEPPDDYVPRVTPWVERRFGPW